MAATNTKQPDGDNIINPDAIVVVDADNGDVIDASAGGTDRIVGSELPDQPAKRRGRKPRSDSTDTGAGTGREEGQTEVKRRGRKGNKATVAISLDQKKLAQQLLGMHQLAALATGIPIVAITESESNMLSEALSDVMLQYDFQVSAKALAWTGLLAASVAIYGPKVLYIMALRQENLRNSTQPDNFNVSIVEGV